MAAFDREIAARYADGFPEFAEKLRGTAERLEAGEQIDGIPGWEISDYVRGVAQYGMYRLTESDQVIEVRRAACNAGPRQPCTLDHDHYIEVDEGQ